MGLEADIDILGRAPLIGLLEADALRLLAFASDTRTLIKGERLFMRGDNSDGAYVVSEGEIRLDGDETGKSDPFTVGPGALIGRMALLIPIVRPATAIAVSPSRVIRITTSVMRRCLLEFPAGAEAIYRAIAGELRHMSEDLERVKHLLDEIETTANRLRRPRNPGRG